MLGGILGDPEILGSLHSPAVGGSSAARHLLHLKAVLATLLGPSNTHRAKLAWAQGVAISSGRLSFEVMQRAPRIAVSLAAVLLCLSCRAHGAEDIITWIRKCGGTVRFSCNRKAKMKGIALQSRPG